MARSFLYANFLPVLCGYCKFSVYSGVVHWHIQVSVLKSVNIAITKICVLHRI